MEKFSRVRSVSVNGETSVWDEPPVAKPVPNEMVAGDTIRYMLDSLHDRLTVLGTAVDDLTEKLSPVLSPLPGTVVERGMIADSEGVSPTVYGLRMMRDRIDHLTHCLIELRERAAV